MTLIEFLNAPIPMYVLVFWFVFVAQDIIMRWFYRNYYSKKCGYDCDNCRAWFCDGKECYYKQKKKIAAD